jgi:RNA polymerase sigma factor (sigma-70 family)
VSIVTVIATGDHDRVEPPQRRHRLPAGLLRLSSDERLVELMRGGSEAAFEALFVRHHRGVLSFCRHMLGSVEEAEDAVQHTFLAAFRDLRDSRKEVALRPWLYAIARNRCLTVLRSRRERVDELAEPSTELLAAEVERRHDLRALLGDLAELPDDQRAALVLAELGDLSHDEIGEALGCRREKVKALVFQARSSLIASRAARELPCHEVREQLANLRGGSLRRNTLRRHLRACEGCRGFQAEVKAQRRALALILPVAPSVGLKAAVLGGGTAAATGSIVAKTLVVVCVAGGGAAAVETVGDEPEGPRVVRSAPDGSGAPAPAAIIGAVEGEEAPVQRSLTPPRRAPQASNAPGRQSENGRRAKAQGPKAERRRRAKARGPRVGHARPEQAQGPKIAPPGEARRTERGSTRRSARAVGRGAADSAPRVVPERPARIVPPAMPETAAEPATPDRAAEPETVAEAPELVTPQEIVPPGRAKKQ